MNFFFSRSTSSSSLFLKNSSKFSKEDSTSKIRYSPCISFVLLLLDKLPLASSQKTCLFFFVVCLTQQLIVSKTAVIVEVKVSLFTSYAETKNSDEVKSICKAIPMLVPESYETAATLRRKLDLSGGLKSYFSFE